LTIVQPLLGQDGRARQDRVTRKREEAGKQELRELQDLAKSGGSLLDSKIGSGLDQTILVVCFDLLLLRPPRALMGGRVPQAEEGKAVLNV